MAKQRKTRKLFSMLVALGAAMPILFALEIGMALSDVSRVVQGVVTGIGFMGAGAILKVTEEHRIRGLTTAGSIWVTAGGVNPTSTIQALALYIADNIKNRLATLFD